MCLLAWKFTCDIRALYFASFAMHFDYFERSQPLFCGVWRDVLAAANLRLSLLQTLQKGGSARAFDRSGARVAL